MFRSSSRGIVSPCTRSNPKYAASRIRGGVSDANATFDLVGALRAQVPLDHRAPGNFGYVNDRRLAAYLAIHQVLHAFIERALEAASRLHATSGPKLGGRELPFRTTDVTYTA
jgi:hypothetical protein